MDISDGEIKDDFSDISEEEYFDNIANKIEKRKLELELLNQIEIVAYDDYAKENRYDNRNRQNINNTSRTDSNFRKDKSRKTSEVRNRSYRASSIFSTSYTLPKRKRQRRKRKYSKIPSRISLSSSDNEGIIEVIRDDSDEDEELLALRLQALTSKQEVKELIEEPEVVEEMVVQPSVELIQNSNEEELLRIAALRSSILKRKDHFRKRKQLRKLENERPYSPTDNFEPILDVAMDLSNSPLGSPFHETILCDMNEEIDMEISCSPVEMLNEDNRESCDMEIVSSPQSKPIENIIEEKEEENDDELALRSMLLSSISDKKKRDVSDKEKVSENEQQDISEPSSPPSIIAKNLKLAVERLKQQKQQVSSKLSQKSGTKTIKMILEEQKNKVKMSKEDSQKSADVPNEPKAEEQAVNEEEIQLEQSETFLIDKITGSPSQNVHDEILDTRRIDIPDSSFSTITDTKNIPLLPETKKLDNRLVTSLDSVLRPVTPLIISLREESSEDEYDIQAKKAKKKANQSSKTQNDFQKKLDHFLKNIRTQQETVSVTKSTTSLNLKTSKDTSPKGRTSAVKHLPLSSQVEYEKLVQKMKILQEAREQREKAGTLKRTKSTSSATDKSSNVTQALPVASKKVQKLLPQKVVPKDVDSKKELPTKTSKIDDALGKIPLLDEAARARLIEKTENNFINHSKNLLESTETNIKLLDENSLDFKRRDKIESKIAEIEKTLGKYKNLLRVVNTRIKLSTPKILQSQRDMIKLRNHQHKFGQICKKVGETVSGDSYSLPNYEESKIDQNYLKISARTDEIHKVLHEQPYASKQFKILSDKVKEFVPKSTAVEANNNDRECKGTVDGECSGRVIIRSVSQLIASCVENEELTATEEIIEVKNPEINRNVKRTMENHAESATKKVRKYESPLEFLKLSSTIIPNSKSVNQIVCPFSMEGTCNDTECKYLHL